LQPANTAPSSAPVSTNLPTNFFMVTKDPPEEKNEPKTKS
jgi:hypothetical protein